MTARPIDPISNLDENLAQVLEAALAETLKRVNVALPAQVLTYDPTRRTATVQPLVQLLLDDGAAMPRAPVGNVPVIWPVAAGFRFYADLQPGDQVLLVFAHRDLSGWQTTGQAGPPPTDRVMSEADAIAIPGLHSSIGGTCRLSDDSTELVLTEGQITVNADRIVFNHALGSESWGA